MNETIRHLDLAIEALRQAKPMMVGLAMPLAELERCRITLVKLNRARLDVV